MIGLLFNKDQNDLFKKQMEDNLEEIKIWNIVNIIIPCFIILIPSLLFSFLPSDRITYQNLILNGSFSFLGINILFSMSVFLINSIRVKDVKVEKQIYEIRIRLIVYLCILLIAGAFLYTLQIAFNMDTDSRVWTTTMGFFIVLFFSSGIGKRIYLIKDELVGKSFKDDVEEKVNNLQSAADDLE